VALIAYGAGELWKRCRIFITPVMGTGLFFGAKPAALVEAVESLKRTRGFNPEFARSCRPVCPKIFQSVT